MDTSLLKFVSVGYVSENKAISDDVLQVVPIEMLGYLDGEIKSDQTSLSAQGIDAKGQKYDCSVQVSSSIKAKWIPEGNRVTAPDMRRGQKVKIYRYSDTDQYHWMALNMDNELRKLETAEWAFSGTADESVEKHDEDNSYRMGISAHKGIVHLTTSKTNGEAAAYKIQINGKDGIVVISDDQGNFFQMDTKEEEFILQNRSGSIVNIDKEDITLSAKGNISINAGKTISLKATDIVTAASATTKMTSPTHSVTGNSYSLKAASASIDSANGSISGASLAISSASTSISGASTSISSASTTLSGASTKLSGASTSISSPSVKLSPSGGLSIGGGGGLSMDMGAVDIKSSGAFDMECDSVDIKSSGAFDVECDSVDLKLSGKFEVETTEVKVSSSGGLSIDGGGGLSMDMGAVDIKSSGAFEVEATEVKVISSGNVAVSSGGDMTIAANGKISLQSSNYKVVSTSVELSFETSSIDLGNATVEANAAELSGTYNFLGEIKHLNKSIGSEHTHTNEADQLPTSGVN